MKVEQKGHTITIKDTQGDLNSFLEKVTSQHYSFQNHNLILDISKLDNITLNEIKFFADLTKAHKKLKKSLVLVAKNIDFNKIPAKMIVVPTLQEAHDIIEMEEIERDLGF